MAPCFYLPGWEVRFASTYPTNIIPGVSLELVPPQQDQWPEVLSHRSRKWVFYPRIPPVQMRVLWLECLPELLLSFVDVNLLLHGSGAALGERWPGRV